jgi:hypothetical protein
VSPPGRDSGPGRSQGHPQTPPNVTAQDSGYGPLRSALDAVTAETVPDDLAARVRARLDDDAALSWDEALAAIAEAADGD